MLTTLLLAAATAGTTVHSSSVRVVRKPAVVQKQVVVRPESRVFYVVGSRVRERYFERLEKDRLRLIIREELERLQTLNQGTGQAVQVQNNQPAVNQYCGKCHVERTDGQFSLLDVRALDAASFGKAVMRVRRGEMPPSGKLPPEEEKRVLRELWNSMQTGAAAPSPSPSPRRDRVPPPPPADDGPQY